MPPGRVIAADWSGAARSEQRGLWLADWDGERHQVTSVQPATRAAAAATMLEAGEAGGPLVIGLDFGFSLPAWWLQANRIASASELWADASRLERWLAECEPPFWGRPGRRRPDFGDRPQWRRTELAACRRPRSVFQIGGAGAVGTASLRGMPALHRLRSAGMAIWPFDRWSTPAVVEVWPRLALGGLVKSDPAARARWVEAQGLLLTGDVAQAALGSADAFDAVAAALALARRCTEPRPDLTDPEVRLEGWIDGVAIVDPPAGAAGAD